MAADMSDLPAPTFAQLLDTTGLWSVAPLFFGGLSALAQGINLRGPISHGRQPMQAVAERTPTAQGKAIAIIKLTGVLMKGSTWGGTSTIQVRRELRQAAADSDIAGILLLVDSVGGSVAGIDDLASEVKAARQAKPVFGHIEDMGASAALWAASQCEKLTANSPTCLVGGVGTVQTLYDESEAAAKQGIRTFVFSTGPLKGLGTPGAPVSDSQAEHTQALVNEVQRSFDAALQSGRRLSASQLVEVRRGGMYAATDAMGCGLIDGICSLAETLSDLTRRANRLPMRNAGGGLPMLN